MKFGDWEALKRCRTSDNREGYLCRCKCGTERVVRLYYLENGKSTNCGCVRKDTLTTQRHGMTKTPLHNCWLNMRARCYNENHEYYDNYGGRGITVCEEWESFDLFHEWSLSTKYRKGLMIERIDNNGNYEPSNCKWATRSEQMNNRRSNALVEISGEVKTKAEWARHFDIPYMEFWKRHKRGDYNNAISSI